MVTERESLETTVRHLNQLTGLEQFSQDQGFVLRDGKLVAFPPEDIEIERKVIALAETSGIAITTRKEGGHLRLTVDPAETLLFLKLQIAQAGINLLEIRDHLATLAGRKIRLNKEGNLIVAIDAQQAVKIQGQLKDSGIQSAIVKLTTDAASERNRVGISINVFQNGLLDHLNNAVESAFEGAGFIGDHGAYSEKIRQRSTSVDGDRSPE